MKKRFTVVLLVAVASFQAQAQTVKSKESEIGVRVNLLIEDGMSRAEALKLVKIRMKNESIPPVPRPKYKGNVEDEGDALYKALEGVDCTSNNSNLKKDYIFEKSLGNRGMATHGTVKQVEESMLGEYYVVYELRGFKTKFQVYYKDPAKLLELEVGSVVYFGGNLSRRGGCFLNHILGDGLVRDKR
jgi:hypothetical protein